MEHCGFPKKRLVCLQLWMSLGNFQGSSSHICAVTKQDLLQLRIAFAIPMY